MAWVIGALVVVAVLAVGGWLLLPTVRTFFRPSFQPTSASDTSALRAQQPGTPPDAGGFGM